MSSSQENNNNIGEVQYSDDDSYGQARESILSANRTSLPQNYGFNVYDIKEAVPRADSDDEKQGKVVNEDSKTEQKIQIPQNEQDRNVPPIMSQVMTEQIEANPQVESHPDQIAAETQEQKLECNEQKQQNANDDAHKDDAQNEQKPVEQTEQNNEQAEEKAQEKQLQQEKFFEQRGTQQFHQETDEKTQEKQVQQEKFYEQRGTQQFHQEAEENNSSEEREEAQQQKASNEEKKEELPQQKQVIQEENGKNQIQQNEDQNKEEEQGIEKAPIESQSMTLQVEKQNIDIYMAIKEAQKQQNQVKEEEQVNEQGQKEQVNEEKEKKQVNLQQEEAAIEQESQEAKKEDPQLTEHVPLEDKVWVKAVSEEVLPETEQVEPSRSYQEQNYREDHFEKKQEHFEEERQQQNQEKQQEKQQENQVEEQEEPKWDDKQQLDLKGKNESMPDSEVLPPSNNSPQKPKDSSQYNIMSHSNLALASVPPEQAPEVKQEQKQEDSQNTQLMSEKPPELEMKKQEFKPMGEQFEQDESPFSRPTEEVSPLVSRPESKRKLSDKAEQQQIQNSESVISRRIMAASTHEKPKKEQKAGKNGTSCACTIM